MYTFDSKTSFLQGSRIKLTTAAPDLLTDSYPLDNSSVTEILEHPRSRTDSSLLNQLIGRIPASDGHNSTTHSWNEVNGDWRHMRNSIPINDVGSTREELLCFDSDQIDVPLLTNTMVNNIFQSPVFPLCIKYILL